MHLCRLPAAAAPGLPPGLCCPWSLLETNHAIPGPLLPFSRCARRKRGGGSDDEPAAPAEPPRRSGRQRKEVSYTEPRLADVLASAPTEVVRFELEGGFCTGHSSARRERSSESLSVLGQLAAPGLSTTPRLAPLPRGAPYNAACPRASP